MGMRLPLLAGLSVLALIGIPRASRAQAPTTQPLELSPTTTSTTAPLRYPEIAPSRYPDTVVTYYSSPGPAPSQFGRNEFELSLGGQGLTAHGDHGHDSIGFVTLDFGWYFVDTLSLDLEVGVSPGANYHHHHHDDNEDEGVRAAEEMVLLRWHFLTAGGLSLYADGGIGGLHASPVFPSGGRRDSFLAAVCGGLTIQLARHFYGGLGARAAWLGGGDWEDNRHHRNWSDGVQYYGELSFIFP